MHNQHQKSLTSLDWHPLIQNLDSILFHRSEAWSHRPRAKHQALAPFLPISLSLKLMFLTVLLTFNTSARAWGQKRWQTKPSQTLQLTMPSETTCGHFPFPHNEYQQRAENAEGWETQGEFHPKKNMSYIHVTSIYLYRVVLQNSKLQKPLPCPISILPPSPFSLGEIHWPNTWTPVQHH